MKNLEQLRAQHALAAAPNIGMGKEGGRAVAKKVPAMIIDNGFIGALAFAIEAKDGKTTVFEAIIAHLQACGMMYGIAKTDPEGFLNELCAKDANVLRAVTAESLAYLNYLRRFAKPGKDDGDDRNRA